MGLKPKDMRLGDHFLFTERLPKVGSQPAVWVRRRGQLTAKQSRGRVVFTIQVWTWDYENRQTGSSVVAWMNGHKKKKVLRNKLVVVPATQVIERLDVEWKKQVA